MLAPFFFFFFGSIKPTEILPKKKFLKEKESFLYHIKTSRILSKSFKCLKTLNLKNVLLELPCGIYSHWEKLREISEHKENQYEGKPE